MSKKRKKVGSRYVYGESYTVGLIVEAYKEFNVVAFDEEDAAEIAEQRARRATVLKQHNYNVGDIEVVLVARKKDGYGSKSK